MPTRDYWRAAEIDAREIASRSTNPTDWLKLAALYRENANREKSDRDPKSHEEQ